MASCKLRAAKRTTRKLVMCYQIRAGASGRWGQRNRSFTPCAVQPISAGKDFSKLSVPMPKFFFSKEVSINFEVTTGSLPKETAVPLALVLNELLTNAAKHGANDRGPVTINVGLNGRSGSHELYVQDRGPGFNFEEAQGRSSGLRTGNDVDATAQGNLHGGTTFWSALHSGISRSIKCCSSTTEQLL